MQQHIEAIIFTAEQPVTLTEIQDCLTKILGAEIAETDILENLNSITNKFQQSDFAFELNEIGGGYQFLTKKQYHQTVSLFLNQKSAKKLSASSLETLAIIAYKQPITKSEIEHIRGVNCDYAVQKLLEKELVVISGRSDMVGRPLLYSTSQSFMDYFGINSVNDLPKLKEVQPQEENEIGLRQAV